MMTVVRGKDVDLYVKRDGVFVFAACATASTIERSADEINTTSADSGRENEYIGGSTDASISFDGVVTLDELSMWQYEEWVANVGNNVDIRIDFTNSYGDRLRYEMNMLITNVGDQNDVNAFSNFSISGRRSGAETVTKTYDNVLLDGGDNLVLDGGGNLIRV